MSIIHVTTEIKGGAGAFVLNLHKTMLNLDVSSKLLTRERADIKNLNTIRPRGYVDILIRSLTLFLLSKVKILNEKYAIFGVEKSPVDSEMISDAIEPNKPTAFVFYWVSYFVNIQTIYNLKSKYPNVPIIFICLDEAFLTGACHYSMGCKGYQMNCSDCPATSLTIIQKRIEDGFKLKKDLISEINPIILYPTSKMEAKGKKSSSLGKLRSGVVPLGAINESEISLFKDSKNKQLNVSSNSSKEKIKILVRSSSEYRKGSDLLIDAIKILKQRNPNLKEELRIISIGDQTLSKSSISQYVDHDFRGMIDRNSLISLYSEINALLVTSREDAGPIMINETVALGIFVISTPVGVAEDLISSDRKGLITSRISAISIADAISVFMERDKDNNNISNSSTKNEINQSLTFEGYINSLNSVIQDNNNL